MEVRDLYDKNRNLTGETIKKGDKVPVGRFYITVIIWIENSEGKFLIQKRSKQKGSKWSSTGGHPVSGQTSIEGAVSELNEELGICVECNELKLFHTIQTEDDFLDLYYLKKDIDLKDMVLQKEEVENVAWLTKEEIDNLIETRQFSDSNKESYQIFIKYLGR